MSSTKLKPIVITSAVGGIAAMALSVALSMAAAGLLSNGAIGLDVLNWLGLAIAGLSVFVGCVIAMRALGEKKVLICCLVLAAYILGAIICGTLLFGGVSQKMIYNVLAGAGGGILGCILSARKNGYKRKH